MSTQHKSGPKVMVQCRIEPVALSRLDELAAAMRPRPSRSEMVNLAVEEYVERHYGKAKAKDRLERS